jgi:hypothetical protein
VSRFFKHPNTKDGRLGKCIACARKDSTEHRWKNVDRIREFDRKRGNRQSVSYLRNWRKSNPEKYAAHIIVGNALASGKIVKQPCEKCESEKHIHGHHNDYSKPLEITWLCCICHKQEHPFKEQYETISK